MSGTELVVHNPRGFADGQWVELFAEEQELRGEPGTMVKISKVDGDILQLDEKILKDLRNQNAFPPAITPTRVRCWDQHETKDITLSNGAVTIVEVTFEKKDDQDALWIPLEDGVEIQFLAQNGTKNDYRTGDYWLIPARVATGNIEWPVDEMDASNKTVPGHKPPNGIRHHYAPLAMILPKKG